jgi:hypothetical protein
MKPFGIGIMILLIVIVLVAGCTQSSPAPALQPVATTTQPASTITLPVEILSPSIVTSSPQAIVTVIHYIVPVKAWKDTELHMAFNAPQNWNVTTRQLSLPEGSQGLEYMTILVPNDVFSIKSYPISLNQDQAYRDTFRTWEPAPVESTVTYNGITFDRFESMNGGKTQVGYVVQKGSANDIGFANVLIYTTDASRPFEKEDFEKVVSSFTYFSKDKASKIPGEEIPRVR